MHVLHVLSTVVQTPCTQIGNIPWSHTYRRVRAIVDTTQLRNKGESNYVRTVCRVLKEERRLSGGALRSTHSSAKCRQQDAEGRGGSHAPGFILVTFLRCKRPCAVSSHATLTTKAGQHSGSSTLQPTGLHVCVGRRVGIHSTLIDALPEGPTQKRQCLAHFARPTSRFDKRATSTFERLSK